MKKSKCSGSMWGIMRLILCFGVIGTKMFVGSWSTFATLPPLPLGSCWGECHNQLPKKDGHCSHMSWASLIALNKISSAQVIIRWKKWRDFKVQPGVVLTRLISFIGSLCLDFLHKRWSIKKAGVHLRIDAKHFRTWAGNGHVAHVELLGKITHTKRIGVLMQIFVNLMLFLRILLIYQEFPPSRQWEAQRVWRVWSLATGHKHCAGKTRHGKP